MEKFSNFLAEVISDIHKLSEFPSLSEIKVKTIWTGCSSSINAKEVPSSSPHTHNQVENGYNKASAEKAGFESILKNSLKSIIPVKIDRDDCSKTVCGPSD